jgi:hypothetical protein
MHSPQMLHEKAKTEEYKKEKSKLFNSFLSYIIFLCGLPAFKFFAGLIIKI